MGRWKVSYRLGFITWEEIWMRFLLVSLRLLTKTQTHLARMVARVHASERWRRTGQGRLPR